MIGSDALLELYSCPTEPDRWRSILDWVCKKVGVRSAVVQRFRRTEESIEQTWIARDTASIRDAHLHDSLVNNSANPRLNPRIIRPHGRNGVIRDADRFSAGCPHLAALKMRLRAAGLGESIGVGVQRGEQESIALVLHRDSGDARPYTRKDEEFLQELLPHVGNAAELSWRLDRRAAEVRQIEEIADALQVGIVICKERRQVHWANGSAHEILDKSSHLSAHNGRLRGRSNDQDKELHALLHSAAIEICETLVLGAGEDDELHIARVPLMTSLDGFALLVSEPRRSLTPSVEDIAKLLRVTHAEARVTAALCAGNTLKEYAHSRGISEGSARNQLKQVLSKTGARRQSELVLHLCGSVIFQARRNRAPANIPDIGLR